jgi:adenylate cyclase
MTEEAVTLQVTARDAIVAVLFADIAGSTRLYEVLGDTQAKALIDEALDGLRAVTAQHRGRVIKTIGDEIMCVFPNADAGFLAASDMQHKIDRLPVVSGTKRMIRAGFHAGQVIEENGDVFGDTVNTAARMAGVARGLQIMTTAATVEKLSPGLRSATRPIAALAVKGKVDDIAVCEVIWREDSDMTTLASSPAMTVTRSSLKLVHSGRQVILDEAMPIASLGRDQASSFVINDLKASRNHAKIERRRDKFFIVDQSTNGTFVTVTGEAEVGLRREEMMLRGSGRIVFGHSIVDGEGDCVDFSVQG